MRCRVLGGVELVDPDGRSHPVGSRNQRLVLAALVAQRGRIVPTDALIDTLWHDQPPRSALPTLRTYVSRLRHQLGDSLRSEPAGFSLQLAADQVDSGQFESLLADARATDDPSDAADLLGRALDLRRGPAFGSEADAPLIRGEAMRLDELAMGARVRLIELQLQLGQAGSAVAGAEALVAEVPHLEPAWEVLVRGLTAMGRTADALRAFHRAVEQLGELGLEPQTGLRDAERDALSPTTAWSPLGAPEGSSGIRRSRAPLALSSLVGRRRDLDALTALLERSRLVTVVGGGGVGKTRLVAELARGLSDAVWVELASLTRHDDVAPSVLAALGVAASGRPPIEVIGQLVDLDVVVVLDNAEHVLEGVADTVTALLATSPRVRVIVTSRERLGVDGEHRWHLAPLRAAPDFDGGAGEAAELFVARAAMSDPTTALDARDQRVTAVVARLDGVPLAIEMAAAQLASMSIDELVDELSRGASLLAAPRRTAGRQRSLSSLIDWSEQLLTDEELTTFHEFSVFAGPVIASDVVGVLEQPDARGSVRALVERSLIETDRADDGTTSFRMLMMVRDHAVSRLRSSGGADRRYRRHAEWFAEQAGIADQALRRGQHRSARIRFDALRDELRVAHRYGRDVDVALANRLSNALYTQARHALFDEPFAWAESVVADSGSQTAGDDPIGAAVWVSAAARSIARGDLVEAWDRCERSISSVVDERERLLVLDLAGDTALFDGRLAQAATLYVELRQLGLAYGDQLYAVIGGAGQGMTLCYDGQIDAALEVVDEVSATTDDIGPIAAGWLDYVRGEAFASVDTARALTHYDRAIDLASTAGSRLLENVARVSAGSLQARVGEVSAAMRSFTSLVKMWLDMGERTHQRTTLRNLVVLLQRAGRPADAAVLLGSISRGAVVTYDAEARRLDAAEEWAIAELGQEQFDVLNSEGAGRDIPGAATWAIAALRRIGD